MPDILKKPNGNIDWNKFFMGLSAAALMLYQGIHTIQISDLQATVVPRAEYQKRHKQVEIDNAELLTRIIKLEQLEHRKIKLEQLEHRKIKLEPSQN